MPGTEFSHYRFASREFSTATLKALEERDSYIVGVQMLPDMTSSLPWANAETGYLVTNLKGEGKVLTHKEVIALSKTPKADSVEGILETITALWEESLTCYKSANTVAGQSLYSGHNEAYKHCMDLLRAFLKEAAKEEKADASIDDGITWINGLIYNSHVTYMYQDHLATLVWLGKARQWGWIFGDIRSHEAFEDILSTMGNFREFVNQRLRAASDFEEDSDGE